MTRAELLDTVCALLPPQLEELIIKIHAPQAYLPGRDAPPASRAVEIVRWAEQQGQLNALERLCAEMTDTGRSGAAGRVQLVSLWWRRVLVVTITSAIGAIIATFGV